MLSLEVLHVEIAQKLQNLEILLIFCNFSVNFQFWLILFSKLTKKYSEKGSNELELMPSFRGAWFLAEIGSRAKIDGGGAPRPPLQTWQALLDVRLVRVKFISIFPGFNTTPAHLRLVLSFGVWPLVLALASAISLASLSHGGTQSALVQFYWSKFKN